MLKQIKRILSKLTGKEAHPDLSECAGIVERINKMRLKSLEDIPCGDVLYVVIKLSVLRNTLFNAIKLFRHVIIEDTMLEKRYGTGRAKIAFLFSNSYREREDHLIKLKKVSALIENRVEFIPGIRKFSIRNFLRYTTNLHLLFSWIRTLKSSLSYKMAVNYAVSLYIAYIDAKYIFEAMTRQEISGVLVTSDLHPIDSLIVHKAKLHGIITATLQHGYYVYESEGFERSPCDYFLALGQASIDNTGRFYNPKQYVKVGMPQLIGENIPDIMIRHNFHMFIMIMSADIEKEIAALRSTEEFSERNDYERIIKLHPGVKSSAYNYEWRVSDYIVHDEYNISQLTEMADFAVIPSGSTVFTEYLVKLFPVLIFDKETPSFELLKNRDYFTFSDSDGLEALVSRIKNDEFERQMKIAREYFTEVNDIAGKYRNFLHYMETLS